jgi:hypothetical protein
VLWPDKPEAGGKFNMKYYTGWVIKSWSTNVGPLGEAFGSFGGLGGILYMAALGLFIRFVYMRMLRIAWSMPLVICWIPVVFYQVSLSSETDTLEILNSLIKSCFFVWLLYKAYPKWFVGEKASSKNRRVA